MSFASTTKQYYATVLQICIIISYLFEIQCSVNLYIKSLKSGIYFQTAN